LYAIKLLFQLTTPMKWSTYNQSLVRRGEILLGFDVIDNSDAELKRAEQRQGCIKNRFTFMIYFLFYLDIPKYTFICQLDRLMVLHKAILKEKYFPYLLLHNKQRRINKLDIQIKEDDKSKEFEDEYITIAIDSTYIKGER
jgi:hypothetical protein